jgi:hypothetical protein
MPKVADYPRASLARTIELADGVERLGGECSMRAAADALGAKPGGTFGALVSTAAKYGWIAVRRGRLRTEPRYRDYRLAYDEAERRARLGDAVRSVPLFRQLLDRFAGKPLPEGHLARLLVREFAVPERIAERVAAYFVEAALEAGLLAGGQLRATATGAAPRDAEHRGRLPPAAPRFEAPASTYRVRISGPDLETTVDVLEPADLELVQSLLAKVTRALRARSG